MTGPMDLLKQVEAEKGAHGIEGLLAQGVGRHFKGDAEGARMLYEEVLALDPRNASAHNNLGFVFAGEGRYAEAVTCYERALACDDTCTMAHTNMGCAKAALGEFSEAISSLEKAVQLDEGNVLAWDNLGRIYLAHGRLTEAERCWLHALARHDDDPRLLTRLGTVLAAQQRFDEAVVPLQEAVRLDAASADSWFQLGVVLFLRRDLGSAQDALLHARDLCPTDIATRHHLALVRQALGNPAGAAAELEAVLREEPGHLDSLLDLAVLRLSSGDYEAARDLCHRALEVGPEGERAVFYEALARDLIEKDSARDVLERVADGGGRYAQRARNYLK